MVAFENHQLVVSLVPKTGAQSPSEISGVANRPYLITLSCGLCNTTVPTLQQMLHYFTSWKIASSLNKNLLAFYLSLFDASFNCHVHFDK